MKKSTIIIVDDDADDREILRDAFMMANESAHCHLLENGDQLLDYLNQHLTLLPSVIMLDLNMPGKDGRETLTEIKSSKQLHSVPVVVFTTSSSPRNKQTLYDAGANCFVSKPDTFNKLVDLTKSIMALWVFGLHDINLSAPD